MIVLYLWKKTYNALSDLDDCFDKIFNLDQDNVSLKYILNFIRFNKIDLVFIQNPYINLKRLKIYKYLKSHDIKILVSDRGALNNSWFFDPNGFNVESSSYDPHNWDFVLSEDKLINVSKFIEKEIKSDISLERQGLRIGKSNLREKLNIQKDKKILFVPLQRPSDTVVKYFSKNVKDMKHFLDNIIQIQEALKKDWVVLVKKHPLESDKLFGDKLNYVDDNTHIKDLVELSNAVVLINSGVGVLSMIYSKPVYHFGDAFYSFPLINKEVVTSNEVIYYLKKNDFKVNNSKVKRFISYLIEEFYSFGNFVTEERIMSDNSKRTITTKINFYKINKSWIKIEN